MICDTVAQLAIARIHGGDAADLVNEVLSSRLYQFEDTVFTELLALFEEYAP